MQDVKYFLPAFPTKNEENGRKEIVPIIYIFQIGGPEPPEGTRGHQSEPKAEKAAESIVR